MEPDLRPMADALKEQVDEHGFIDVGDNIEKDLPVSRTELNVALTMLKDEGYQVHTMRAQHMDSAKMGHFKVLVGPDVTPEDVWHNREKIRLADFTQ